MFCLGQGNSASWTSEGQQQHWGHTTRDTVELQQQDMSMSGRLPRSAEQNGIVHIFVVVLGASVVAHNKMRAWEASAGTLMMSKIITIKFLFLCPPSSPFPFLRPS